MIEKYNNRNQASCTGQALKESKISSAMSKTEINLNTLEERINILSGRLGNILTPVPTSCAEESDKGPPSNESPLTRAIELQAKRVEKFCTQINNLVLGIEL